MGNKGLYIVAIVALTVAAVCLGLLYNRAKANDRWVKLRNALDDEANNIKKPEDGENATT